MVDKRNRVRVKTREFLASCVDRHKVSRAQASKKPCSVRIVKSSYASNRSKSRPNLHRHPRGEVREEMFCAGVAFFDVCGFWAILKKSLQNIATGFFGSTPRPL